MSSIAANLQQLHNRIADACARANRPPSDVALMAVSKMHPAEAILEAHAAGQRLFGENRVQEFATKVPALSTLYSLPSTPCFHLIGPLQNNKTTKAAELFHAVDTIDSLKTAQRLNDAALTNLRASGLMTVPPWSEDAETARPYFQHLRRLRDENLAAHPTLTQLSMGMSNDFVVAIEEGSTTIRIGTAIFGKRTYA